MPALDPASIPWDSPLLWALLIGWIFTVALHEFAHGLVALLGGDYTIRERGGLSLNPFQYMDPLMSIVFPLIFVLMGGAPLAGGATYIRNDLLRSRAWETAVSLAGPAMNLLIFFALAVSMHPAVGYFNYDLPVQNWTNMQIFIGALATLQAMSVVLNLIPWPPVDGFNALAPYLPERFVEQVRTPPMNFILIAFFYFTITQVPFVMLAVVKLMFLAPRLLGMEPEVAVRMFECFEVALGR